MSRMQLRRGPARAGVVGRGPSRGRSGPPPADWGALRARALAALGPFGRQIPDAQREELAQEAVTRMVEQLEVRDPGAFVRQVATNLAIDLLRRERQVRVPFVDDELPDGGWQRRIEARLDLARALRVVASAPPGYRAVLEAVLDDRPMSELIEREPAGRAGPRARSRAKETVYRRRSRAFVWVRARLGR